MVDRLAGTGREPVGPGWDPGGKRVEPDGDRVGTKWEPGRKQVGILRSPTFEITTDRIHVLMKASPNAAVRVVIDNFQMAEFNALLFRGTFMNNKGTDTQGNWQWKSLAGDLRKYKGHKGYLEFIDPGDATIAIDKIVLSDGGPPGKQRADQSKFNAEALNELHDQAVLDLKSGTSNQLISALLLPLCESFVLAPTK